MSESSPDANAEKVEELRELLAKLEEERALWREELREVRERLERLDKVLLLYGVRLPAPMLEDKS